MTEKRLKSNDGAMVSIIIPVYNGERFLRRCLDSVFAQTIDDFEVIVVDDGSDDATSDILDEYRTRHSALKILSQHNCGQGHARNRALALARGRYILFLDSDDFIERVTLEIVIARAEQDKADLVHFDWKLVLDHSADEQKYHYYNVEPFWHNRTLSGANCEQLLSLRHYFSVTNLYRKSFLETNRIQFEEGQIYEDNAFLARVFTRANRVSLVHSPLYVIQPNSHSSTKTGTDTDRHARDHLLALGKCFNLATPRSPDSWGRLADYHCRKFLIYYQRRVPKQFRAQYAREFVKILGDQNIDLTYRTGYTSRFTRLCFRLGIFRHGRARHLRTLIAAWRFATPLARACIRVLRWIRKCLMTPRAAVGQLLTLRPPNLEKGTILFLGFDGRFTGNSRALFERMNSDKSFSNRRILFTTKDPRVKEGQRISPGTISFYRAVGRAEFVIAESWVSTMIPKHPDSTWIQLWHGTPIKRMLFDSHEREITLASPAHKITKYADIQRWDYFLVDSRRAEERFSTAFLIPPNRFLRSEYPRVTRMRERMAEPRLREQLIASVGRGRIKQNTRVILYVPTWRDHNFGLPKSRRDSSYLLDLVELASEINGDIVFLFKDHEYLPAEPKAARAESVIRTSAEIEDLMLLADVVLTDYSSAGFDAMSLGIPVVFYQGDVASFTASRGVYPERLKVYKSRGELTKALDAAQLERPLVSPWFPPYSERDTLMEFLRGRVVTSRPQSPEQIEDST